MQYFVSAENSSYFYWQLELLIESFIMQGLENDLVIGLAENNDQKIRGYSSNLVRYGNKFMHQNEGRDADYLPLNRVHAIRYALAYKLIKFPFAIIHIILKNPIKLSNEDEDYGIIINNFEEISEGETKNIKEEIAPSIAKLAEDRKAKIEDLPKIPFFSAPIVFTEKMEYFADTFFTRLQFNMLEILKNKGEKFPCERAAWELTLTESFQHCVMKGKFMAASMMHDGDNVNFIHYKSGIPPVFHKKFYEYNQGIYYAGSGPYETILEHNPTTSTAFVHQVIKSRNKRSGK